MAANTVQAQQNLPLELNRFVGRERDLDAISRLLRTQRVLTLCGVGGIGKTRLALRAAAQATERFRDGVWLCELAETTTRKEVVARIAAVLSAREDSERSPEQALSDVLRTRRLLLVLDNCEHAVADVSAVVEHLVARCPGVSFLVTSREPLRVPEETVWRVLPLTVPEPGHGDPLSTESVQLFVDRARANAHDFAVTPERLDAIAEICRRLDGIPLGIELAAARVRLLSVAQIAERLGDRFTVLTSGDRGAPARQQTLRAVIDWSHGMLDGPEQTLLRRLSVFSGWDLESAESVCADEALPARSLLDLIVSLVDRSLVVVVGEAQARMRYRMLDTIRHYAAARLAESGEEERLRLRHRAQMLALAEEAARNAVSGRGTPWALRFSSFQRVRDDYCNMRAALGWSADRGDAVEGLRLCVALRPYWMVSGLLSEGAYWTDRFLAMDCADEALRGRAMVRRAELAWDQQDHVHAVRVGEEGLWRCQDAGDHASVALALNILAMTDIRARNLERARERLAEAVALTRATDDPWNEGVALGAQGALAAREGRLAEAEARYEEALALLRTLDHRWGVGLILIGQGGVAEARGDLSGAERCFREALDIQRAIGGAPELARCLAGVGRVLARQGRVGEAYDSLCESLTLCHDTGQRLGTARGLLAIATVAAAQGYAEEATRLAGAAAGIRERSGHPAAGSPWPMRDGVFAARWEEGRRLDADQAVRSALRLARVSRSPRRPPPVGVDTAALTPREREVAVLIGQGMTNRSIGERLFISPATVARHVANINTKLGFNSRTQIAAWINRG
ncbi:tetratricopeptide repeat protein [Thermobifida halotolerans]|uniref:Tetratricopeptide repeat protein n=1 Tax=Thermobifida halotolerans TaxID=483545 RepID=A0A399G539_9ACTN|nr:LuxR C-terminal-related transcriptional regulator [Thermobifida halotolerans]UOE19850.1 tetratricopeptide repeat protein [Thermobifida halotolerans]